MPDHDEEGPSLGPGRQPPEGDQPSENAVRDEQSHAAPSTPVLADGDPRTRRRRLTQLAIVAAIVVAALAVLVVTAGGSSAPPKPGGPQASRTARAITGLLAGIPQNAKTLGRPTAPVTLRWFGDLECPFCKEFTLGALPALINHWVRAGDLRIEYVSMETATREAKLFVRQQVAALSAGEQNKLWNYIETFYHEQGEEDSGYVTEKYLQGLASQIPGLDVTLWGEDRYDPQLATQVIDERRAALRAGFRGTPSFLIGYTGEQLFKLSPASLTKPDQYNELIEDLLRAGHYATPGLRSHN